MEWELDRVEAERATKLHQESMVIDSLGSEPGVWSDHSVRILKEMIAVHQPTWKIFY